MNVIHINIVNHDGKISKTSIEFEDKEDCDNFCHELEHERNLHYSNVLAKAITQD
jgi:hypothetical protein